MSRRTQPRPPLSDYEMAGARIMSRLERREPGIVRRILNEAVASGQEPSREYLNRRLCEELVEAPAS